MKILKSILPIIIAYLFTSLIFNRFSVFTMNIGSAWINLKFYFVLVLACLLTLLFFKLKIFYYYYLIFLAVYIILNSSHLLDVFNDSFLVFLIVFSVSFYLVNTSFNFKKKS